MHTIGRAAERAGLSVDTLRYYEREDLLPSPRRTAARYRLYDQAAIDRLRFINRAKSLGFTLAEIRELLQLNDGGGQGDSVRTIARQRADEIGQVGQTVQRGGQQSFGRFRQCVPEIFLIAAEP
jgi:MerR family copper efflux transcriptional regulator